MQFPLRDGSLLPSPGFGTWRCDPEKLEEAVYHALKVGYRHIDCAGLYKNEHIVGRAIARALADGTLSSPTDLWLTSKIAPTQMGDPSLVEPALRKTLADLGVARIDHLVTHWPYAIAADCAVAPAPAEARLGYSPAAFLRVWRAMEECVGKGLVRTLGCSNMTAKKLQALIEGVKEGEGEGGEAAVEAAAVLPVSVQVEMHPFLAQPALVAYCRAKGIVLTGYCPLGSPGRPAAYRAEGDPDVLAAPAVARAAAALGKSPAQVVLRWAAMRGTVPLPRSTNPARVEENFAGVADPSWTLPAEVVAELDALDRTRGSGGRIMKGDNFVQGGRDWREVWDEEFMDAWEKQEGGKEAAAT